MRKIIAYILIAILAVTLAACGAQNGPVTEPLSGQTEEDVGGIHVGGVTVRFTNELNHGELHFKDIDGSEKAGYEQAFNLTRSKDGEFVFAIRLVYFKQSTVEEVMTGSDQTLTEKNVNGVGYFYFEYDENGTPGHTYLYSFNDTVYTISFVSAYDMTALETAFLSNAYFQ